MKNDFHAPADKRIDKKDPKVLVKRMKGDIAHLRSFIRCDQAVVMPESAPWGTMKLIAFSTTSTVTRFCQTSSPSSA